MKRSLAPAVSAIALLLLAGCSSEVTSESITITPGQSGTFISGGSTIVVGGDATAAPRDEAAYLSEVREEGNGAFSAASDADLLAAGDSACDQLDQGIDDDKVAVSLAGAALSPGGDDALTVVDAASISLCG